MACFLTHSVVTCYLQFGQVVNIGWAPDRGDPSNFVFKLTMLTVETLSYFAVWTAWSICNCFVTIQLFCSRCTSCYRRRTSCSVKLPPSGHKKWALEGEEKGTGRTTCISYYFSLCNTLALHTTHDRLLRMHEIRKDFLLILSSNLICG